MLWNYAPAENMVGGRRPGDRICGAGRRDLQVDRRRWCGALLRPGSARVGKNLHGKFEHQFLKIHGRQALGCRTSTAEQRIGAGLFRIFDHLTEIRRNIFRRQPGRGEFDAGTRSQRRSEHHLAPERQTGGRSGQFNLVRTAAIGSRQLCPRGDHHRSANGRIANHQQRQFFRAPAFRAGSAAQVTLFSRLRTQRVR
jgi:hypothetical protein